MKKLIITLFCLIYVVVSNAQSLATKNKVDPEDEIQKGIVLNKDEFYCIGWLNNFPDTIIVYSEFSLLPKNIEYSQLLKINKHTYDLLMWTANIGLETPTQLKNKLKIKFKNDLMIFKLGNLKYEYLIEKGINNELLIKNK
jgi:hypothetical protein